MKGRQIIVLSGEPQREHLLRFIGAIPLDKPVKVTLEDFKKKRSVGQNALRWMWLSEITKLISDQTGNDADDLNDFFKKKFLVPRVIEVNGQVVEQYTTKHLTTEEMSRFIDAIYQFAVQELQIFLPLPEELGRQ